MSKEMSIKEVPVETADVPDEPQGETPLSTVEEDEQPETADAVEVEAPTPTPKAKAKAKMGRPVGKKDTKQRAKPKPKAKIVPVPVYESSESSEDEATTQELHALQLIRSIRAYDIGRADRKNQKYASWFGR